MKKTKIGVLGSGDVGQTLGGAFATLGHNVMMGSRDRKNEKALGWANSTGENASVGTFAQAAEFGELIVLATLGTATEAIVRAAGAETFAGKTVIDATNPLTFSPNGPPGLSVGFDDSLGERIQRLAPEARVVKAFNTVGHTLMFQPQLPGGPPDMFLCGNDEDAKKSVSEICREFGWGVIDLGGIEASRYLEPLCMAWVLHGIRSGSWTHAFKMLHS
ncbi:MAG: NADPH-dependent F420 reductase [Thermoanaerobaculia bacterium]